MQKKSGRGLSGYLILGGQVVMWRAPSFLPKTGWAIAHPAHPPLTPLSGIMKSGLDAMPLFFLDDLLTIVKLAVIDGQQGNQPKRVVQIPTLYAQLHRRRWVKFMRLTKRN